MNANNLITDFFKFRSRLIIRNNLRYYKGFLSLMLFMYSESFTYSTLTTLAGRTGSQRGSW